MKKNEMIEELNENGYETDGLNWKDLQELYKEKKQFFVELSKPTEESVEEHLEKKIEKKPELKPTLEEKRLEMFPKIVDLMKRLKGRSSASHEELREMFDLYNAFYLRSDSPSCGSCVGRVYTVFQKICKGRY